MENFSFNLDKSPPECPDISVICINKNHANFLKENILSVLSQNFDNFEFIIADGGSTDSSLNLIAKHKFIRVLSGPDSSRIEGFRRALSAARGRFVMITTSSDGYLSRDWFRAAAEHLKSNPETSLVFGASVSMNAQGRLGSISYPLAFPFNKVPSKEDWPLLWLMNGIKGSYLPELNYCVRIELYRKLLELNSEFAELNEIDPILKFHFEFNRLGYMPQYLPILANFGRTHENQMQFTKEHQETARLYKSAWKIYRIHIALGRAECFLRDSHGSKLRKIRFSLITRIRLLMPSLPTLFSILNRLVNKLA